MMKKWVGVLLVALIIIALWEYQSVIRIYQGATIYFNSRNRIAFYKLQNNQKITEITNKLKQDKTIPLNLREPLIKGERRIYVFKYISDGNEVAGYLSLIPEGKHPTVLFLRGGNGNFGILRPNNVFSSLEGYNVIGTLYRGNLYGGHDQFGGEDINDIENLILFLPELEGYTGAQFKPPYAMIGVSRGAMQMFTSLSRSSVVKANVNKAISLSGNVDLNVTAKTRPDMKYMFNKKFKEENTTHSFQEWLDYRDPVTQVSQLNPNLSVLLIQGLEDNRVALAAPTNLNDALKKHHIKTQFIKLPGAKHSMDGYIEEVKDIIIKFLN
jgi:dipeptidyl aminopeptidase/acylaminoacyl peptidase